MIGKLILTTLILLAQSANAQATSSTRILGIGIGTLIIIISVIFAIVWCLACRNSSRPELYSLIGLLVPVILIIAFALTPKSSQRSATTNVTDSNFIPHIVFMVLSLLGFLISGVFLLINEAFTYKKAKNVARSAFTVREEQEQEQVLNGSRHRSQLQIQSNAQTQNMQA